jgi:hypothetical protein
MERLASDLRYVDADRVDTPAGRLNDTVVVDPSHATLGKLAGIVVDPVGRRVHGYVIESRKWLSSRHYIVPPGPMRLDRDHHALEVDLYETQLDEVEPHTIPRFSDDDLIAALFRTRPDNV